jgi:hypothetical protein
MLIDFLTGLFSSKKKPDYTNPEENEYLQDIPDATDPEQNEYLQDLPEVVTKEPEVVTPKGGYDLTGKGGKLFVQRQPIDYDMGAEAAIQESAGLSGKMKEIADANKPRWQPAGRPISTLTGKEVPTSEENFETGNKRGLLMMSLPAYALAAFTRGVIPRALETSVGNVYTKTFMGKDYISPIDEALKASGKNIPGAGPAIIGTAAQLTGATVPIRLAFRAANEIMAAMGLPTDLVLSSGSAVEQIAAHALRGGAAGTIYGGTTQGTPEAMKDDALFFAGLEGALGATGIALQKMVDSNWFRRLTVKERGLVVQNLDDMIARGYPVDDLLDKGFSPDDLIKKGFTIDQVFNKQPEGAAAAFAKANGIKWPVEKPLVPKPSIGPGLRSNQAIKRAEILKRELNPETNQLYTEPEIAAILEKEFAPAVETVPETAAAADPKAQTKQIYDAFKEQAETGADIQTLISGKNTIVSQFPHLEDELNKIIIDAKAAKPIVPPVEVKPETPEEPAIPEKERHLMGRDEFIQNAKNKLGNKFLPDGSPFGTEGQFTIAAGSAHREFVKQAIASGELTPEDAVKLHKQDYSDIETWPEIKAPEKPLAPETSPDSTASFEPPKQAQGQVLSVPIESLTVAPEKFQWRRNLGQGGVDSSLKHIKVWNPDLAGVVAAWKDPADGKTYIINGHHRYERAAALGVKNLDIKYINAPDAKNAKMIGALINIAEGHGEPVDAAIALRESGKTGKQLEEEYGISLKRSLAQKGFALSKLDRGIITAIQNGEIPEEWGVIIGNSIESEDTQWLTVKSLLREKTKGRRITDRFVEEYTNEINGIPKIVHVQKILFGDEVTETPIIVERTELREYAAKQIAEDKSLFGLVSKSSKAQRLTEEGSTVDVDRSKKIAEDAKTASEALARFASIKGIINDLLNKYAEELANAKSTGTRNEIKQNFYTELRAAIPDVIAGRLESGSGGVSKDSGPEVVKPAEETVVEPDLFGKPAPKAEAEKAKWYINADDRPIFTYPSDAVGYRGPYSKREVSELTGTDYSYLDKKELGKPVYTPDVPATPTAPSVPKAASPDDAKPEIKAGEGTAKPESQPAKPTMEKFAEKTPEERKDAVALAKSFTPGDKVSWTDSKGEIHTGKVAKRQTGSIGQDYRDQGLVLVSTDAGNNTVSADLLKKEVEAKPPEATPAKKVGEALTDSELSDLFDEAKTEIAGDSSEKTYDALADIFKTIKEPEAEYKPSLIDPNVYKAVKPLFLESYNQFLPSGREVKEWIKDIIQKMESRGVPMEKAKPYIIHFYQNDRPVVTDQLQALKQIANNKIAGKVAAFLESSKAPLDTNTLFGWADEAFFGTQAEGKYTSKDAYDAMELGINKFIAEKKVQVSREKSYSFFDPTEDAQWAKGNLRDLRLQVIEKIPTQTKRTAEMDQFQQFSTPPTISYLANWVANIQNGELYLEPSAGIGGLAVFGKLAGAKVVVNELSPRRRDLLLQMGFDLVLGENGEQLNNVLPKVIKPSVIVMNPPFSATAGRLEKTSSTEGFKHVEQALKRLEPEGRSVVILGKGITETQAFKKWLTSLGNDYTLRADIGISGKEYQKYGTTFGNQLLVFDKISPSETKPTITGYVEKVEDAIDLLKGVRDERIKGKQLTSQQDIKGISQGSGGGARPVGSVLPATGLMGSGERPQGGLPGARLDTDPNAAIAGPGNATPGITKPERPGGNLGSTRKPQKTEGSGLVDIGQADGTTGSIPGTESGTDNKLSLEKTDRVQHEDELTDSVYEPYVPQKVKIAGAKIHPGKLVESAAMSAVEPPDPKYTPRIAQDIIDTGKLSAAQLESIVYAGQAHSQTLENGSRRGYFIGDGTGVGKGREIGGILLDNWNQGRHKAIWISQNSPLIEDAKRDVKGIGWKPELIIDLSKTKVSNKIPEKQKGVYFVGYPLLKSEGQKTPDEKRRGVSSEHSRLKQLVDWFGKDYDGVIVFDESHNMGNALAVRGKRGTSKPSKTALSGVELQRQLPNARVVYVSATGATEVMNLAYADRLGLWGEGTPFANKGDFVNQISSGGLAAMELVARDMKAMGQYLSRSLSYEDVKYESLQHLLSPQQREKYDEFAGAWQMVLADVEAALAITNGDKNGKSKGAALAQFWGSSQRFFNQVITSMQTPAVVNSIEKDLKNGHAVVIQIVNTNEAATGRALAKLEEEDCLEDLDLTPKEMIMDYVRNSFPVAQYEESLDDDGNIIYVAVLDSAGNPVENADAVAKREELLDKLGSIRGIDGPMEILLDHFGTDKVAEITGRTRRVVYGKDAQGNKVKVIERRSKSKTMSDADAFMNDKKPILIFSYAGGTGRSYHADLAAKNQRLRRHYLLQAGWRADRAIQGFGRTHRSSQKQAPEYVLVTTDIIGQKRFISSIARRLDQLGALTKGQRQTGSGGFFTARDNLESEYAQDALNSMIFDIFRGRSSMTMSEFMQQTGLKNLVDKKTGALNQTAMPVVTQFLNRLLAMNLDKQAEVFEDFSARLDANVRSALERGDLDVGLETLKAKGIKKVSEKPVYVDKSGAKTNYVELDVTQDARLLSFDEARISYSGWGFYQNIKSGQIWGASASRSKTNPNTGAIMSYHQLRGPGGTFHNVELDKLIDPERYINLTREQAEDLWDRELAALPKTITYRENIITGTILPIWDRLKGYGRIMRLQTDDGERMIGRYIPAEFLKETLENLGVSASEQNRSPEEVFSQILGHGVQVKLSNGWKIVRRRVSGENRIEIVGPDYRHTSELDKHGVFQERIQYETRYFIPTTENGIDTLAAITKNRPIVNMTIPTKLKENIPDSISEPTAGYENKTELPTYTMSEKGVLTSTPGKDYINEQQGSLFGDEKPKRKEKQGSLFGATIPGPKLRPDNASPGVDVLRGREIPDGGRNLRRTSYTPDSGTIPEVSSKPIGTWKSSRSSINSVEDAAVIARDNIGSDAQETLISLVTDNSGKILAINQHSIGGTGVSQIYPAILSGQILNVPGAKNAWLIHNHPSGKATLTPEDITAGSNIGRLLDKSGIRVQPVIAITPANYSSVGTPDRVMPAKGKAVHSFDVLGRKFDQHPEGLIGITDQIKLSEFGDKHLPDGGIILINGQNNPLAVIKISDYSKLKPSHLDVLKEAERRNAAGFIVYDKNKTLSESDLRNLVGFQNSSSLGLITAVDKTGDRFDDIVLRKTASGGKMEFFSIKGQGGKTNEGRRAVGENKNGERGSVLPEVREEHARQVDAQRQVSAKNPQAPSAFREACEKGQGLTHYPEGYSDPEFAELRDISEGHGLDLVPVKDTSDTINAVIRDGRVFLNMMREKGSDTLKHVVLHEISHARGNETTQEKIDTQSEAFRKYRHKLSWYYFGTPSRLLSTKHVLEEFAADLESGVDSRYGIKLADGLKKGETVAPITIDRVSQTGKEARKARGPPENETYMVTYHGTPHVWPPEKGFPHGRPRLDKTGTGEGAAAYGWGWYSAEAEGTGKEYRERLAHDGINKKIEREYNQEVLDSWKSFKQISPEQAREFMLAIKDIAYNTPSEEDYAAELQNTLGGYSKVEDIDVSDAKRVTFPEDFFTRKEAASLYKLDIPDDVIPKLLDWDKPADKKIWVKILTQMRKENLPDIWSDSGMGKIHGLIGNETGQKIYASLSKTLGSYKNVSEFLARAGIPGNKYLDQMSRDRVPLKIHELNGELWVQDNTTGKMLKFESRAEAEKFSRKSITYNYVIWDQKVLDRVALLERNGERLDAMRKAEGERYSIRNKETPGSLFPEVNKRLEESKGIKYASLTDKTKDALVTGWESFTRHFPHLDPKTDGEVIDIFRRFQDVPGWSKHETIRRLEEFVGKLSPGDRHVFTMNIILPDMLRDLDSGPLQIEEDQELPFGYKNKEEVQQDRDNFKDLADNNPAIKEALAKRNSFMKSLTDQLVEHDLLDGEKAKDPASYFHHQVLDYMNYKENPNWGIASKDVRTHRKGWQIGRVGSTLDYNTEYVESEFEVISQALTQIETVKTLKRIKDAADIKPELEAQAKDQNMKTFYKKAMTNPLEDPLAPYKQQIAIGYSKLGKMVAAGTLEAPSSFDDVIEHIADQAEIRKASKQDGVEFNPESHPRMFALLNYLVTHGGPGSGPAASIFKAIVDRNAFIKQVVGKDWVTYNDLIPEGYEAHKPEARSAFFFANTMTDQALSMVVSGKKDLNDVIKRELVRGYDEIWIVKKGISKTLNDFRPAIEGSLPERISADMLSVWKQWVLMNPYRVIKYNLNNMSGDLDICLAYDPKIVWNYFRPAFKDLVAASRGKAASSLLDDLSEMNKLGVIGSGMTNIDIPELSGVESIKGLVDFFDGKSKNALTRWYNMNKQLSTLRENILRLAAYRYFLDKLNKGELVYGASRKTEVDPIEDKSEKAAKLARELVGDYGNISHAGQWVRKRLIPFFSWAEINAPRYVRLLKNMKHEGSDKKWKYGGAATAFAWKGTKLALKASALMGMVMMWNAAMFPKEERELQRSGREQLHLILYRRKDGSIVTIRFQGALSDALAWFGMSNPVEQIKEVYKGEKGSGELTKDVGFGWLLKLFQGLRPEAKLLFETLSGQGFYPDPLHPRPIRDTTEHILRTFSLDKLYNMAAGKPRKGGSWESQLLRDIEGMLLYEADPGEQAYYTIRKDVFDWLEKNGKEKPVTMPTGRANNLYYYKQALKYGDFDAAQRYLKKYEEAGGKWKNIRTSIKRADPLASLGGRDRRKFRETLTPEQKQTLLIASEWYKRHYVDTYRDPRARKAATE